MGPGCLSSVAGGCVDRLELLESELKLRRFELIGMRDWESGL